MAPANNVTLPVIDFAPFYGDDAVQKQTLVHEIQRACEHNGFFQITGHCVSSQLCEEMMACSKKFFDLPTEEKLKDSTKTNTWNRGYDPLQSQMLEVDTSPELKEGFYIGDDIPKTHPYFIQKKINCGPNVWPSMNSNAADAENFKETSMTYYREQCNLAKDVLSVLAKTLDLRDDFFKEFTEGAVATLRLLHYPPQPADSDEKKARGIGAHTDFGSVTLLLQGEVDGLQVLDQSSREWIDVQPHPNAFVVNLGNMMMRWSNDRYISNLHRVINKSGKERYSIVFFYGGNPDYVISCLPNCEDGEKGAKYPPVTVQETVKSNFVDSYGRAARYKEEMERNAKANGVDVGA